MWVHLLGVPAPDRLLGLRHRGSTRLRSLLAPYTWGSTLQPRGACLWVRWLVPSPHRCSVSSVPSGAAPQALFPYHSWPQGSCPSSFWGKGEGTPQGKQGGGAGTLEGPPMAVGPVSEPWPSLPPWASVRGLRAVPVGQEGRWAWRRQGAQAGRIRSPGPTPGRGQGDPGGPRLPVEPSGSHTDSDAPAPSKAAWGLARSPQRAGAAGGWALVQGTSWP